MVKGLGFRVYDLGLLFFDDSWSGCIGFLQNSGECLVGPSGRVAGGGGGRGEGL